MKRVVSNKSGNEIYGSKWQHIESRSELERDDDFESTRTAPVSLTVAESSKLESPTTTGHGDNESQIPQGTTRVVSLLGESMYQAAHEGDWIAAEILVAQDSTLATDYVTGDGDRALHVAVAMKHKEFVQKLIKQMRTSDLTLQDGRGYTACCYAAISGVVEIARVMIEKYRNLATVHDYKNETPLLKAALHGNKKMLSYLLECSDVKDLSDQEWLHLLLVTISSQMYGVSVEILGKNGYIATMVNEEGSTALHLLARQSMISNAMIWSDLTSSPKSTLYHLGITLLDDRDGDEDAPDFGKLARKLLVEMQILGKSSLLELIKKPHNILHDAATEGHMELVTMIIHTYPQLIRDTDSNGYTIFHIAAKYRNISVFNQIYKLYPMIDFDTLISQDKNGDNILHLAAKSAPPNKMKRPPVIVMQRELRWFKAAEKILPPSCVMMRNKDKLTPRDLFSEEHTVLLKNCEMWMRNMADSCMLIATLLMSQTGQPVLAKNRWFKIFLVFEVLGLVSSIASIVMFWSIMTSRFAQEDFLSKLPAQQMIGFQAMSSSLLCAFLVFMSSISLYNLNLNGLLLFVYSSVGFPSMIRGPRVATHRRFTATWPAMGE